MAFEKHIVTAAPVRRPELPVSVRLSKSGSLSKAYLMIGLKAKFAADAKMGGGDRFDLLIGSGDDLGVVQIVRGPDGQVAAKASKQVVTLNFRHVPRFGSTVRPREWCAADLVNADTVEITLPSWAIETPEAV